MHPEWLVGASKMSSVFLVEDEALIRMLLADMIQELGHTVAAEAGSIDEGMSLARSAEFDLPAAACWQSWC